MRRSLDHALILICLVAALLASPLAMADWRKELGIFRVGMIEAAAPPIAGREALKRAFEAALGMPVEVVIFRDWPQLVDAQASARVNYAVYSSAAYATASELCRCIEPLAAPLDIDGAKGVRAVVLARRNKIDSLEDLAGIKVAAPAADDLTGWLAPMALLPGAGVTMNGDVSFLLRSDSASDALERFRSGDADAIFGWERAKSSLDGPLAGGTADLAAEVETVVLWRSPLLRFGPHAVLRSVDGEAKEMLADMLLGLRDKNPQAYDLLSQGHGGGFEATADSEYAVMREIVTKAAARKP